MERGVDYSFKNTRNCEYTSHNSAASDEEHEETLLLNLILDKNGAEFISEENGWVEMMH